jgi:hypothetical protein
VAVRMHEWRRLRALPRGGTTAIGLVALDRQS